MCYMKAKLNIEMEAEIVTKLRKYFPGEIGYHLEKKAVEFIAEMEEPPKPFRKEFVIHEEGIWICYAPGKYMGRSQFDRLSARIPKGVLMTSDLIVRMISGEVEAWRTVSKTGLWPGKVEGGN